jgi:CRP-like cAMP-binding protein
MITMRQFAPGETIIREGEVGESAYIIEKGKVEITKSNNGEAVHIAFLEVGSTFGEMSMIDEIPRSATVTASEKTLVREVHRDDLYATMKEDPDVVIAIIKRLFERLREANLKLAQVGPVKASIPASSVAKIMAAASPNPIAKAMYSIEALTPQAIEAISDNPLTFSVFPFKIGRKSKDPIVSNHMEITDQAPLQVSRHHVSIVRDGDRIGVVDRGSQLGASVDNVRIGGKNSPGPVYFSGPEGILVLGPESSPYRFKIKAVES